MKILGLHSEYRDHTPGVIVEMTGSELEAIAGHGFQSLSRVRPGQMIDVTDRWRHLIAVESNIRDAKTLPQKLRTLADMLDMNVPAIVAIAAPPTDVAVSE